MKKLIALFLLSSFAANADPLNLKFVPKWYMTGNEACYNFDDAKKLVALDLQIQNDQDLCAALQTSTDDYKGALALRQQQITGLETENKRLSNSLVQAIKDKNTAEGKVGGTPTEWLVIGGAGAVILGVVIGAYVLHH